MTDPATSTVTTKEEESPLSSTTTSATTTTTTSAKSALQDNIESKGKNAYYFAHAHKANGPAWDGKIQPKLLSKGSSSNILETQGKKVASFEYHKSNITSYAFSDEGKTVKLYITLPGVGEKCQQEGDITLEFSSRSFCLVIHNYKEENVGTEKTAETKCLSFGKLTADIQDAQYKLKKDRIIVILKKQDAEKTWHTINDKGAADHELV